MNIIENIEAYYKISQQYVYNYEIRNYKMLQNINKFKNYNTILMNDINKIINDNNIANKLNYLIDISNKMSNKTNEDIFNNYINKKNKFIKNPNIKYKMDIVLNNDTHGEYDIFEVYTLYKDNKEYLVSPNAKNHNLDIYSLLDNKKILSLKGHNRYITTVRYFFNHKDYNEYLISADHNKIVIIWDITYNYNIKYQIYTNYRKDIYSCLLAFPHNKDNYIITSSKHYSTYIENSATKVFSLTNGNFIRYIEGSNKIATNYLLFWHNINNDKDYIIQFSWGKILINNLFEDEIYEEINKKVNNGFIYHKDNNDYLYLTSLYGKSIYIWDLLKQRMFKIIDIDLNFDFFILPWNDKYIIAYDEKINSIVIVDRFHNKIISKIKALNNKKILNIKKINHPIYGESLLSCDDEKTIKLWTI